MAVNLGTAFGMVKIDASGVAAGMQTAREAFDSGLSQVGSSIQNVGSQISGLGSAMAGMAAPLVAGFGIATKGAVDFDEAVTNIGAVMNLSRDEVEALKEQLLTIGGSSVQGPQAVAEAYYDIAGGVADASTHMAILQASIDTATAGNSDLRGTTNALISVMNSYKFGADKAAYSSNVLTKTVGMGVGTMDEFASALPQVTGLANSLNISFDDLAGMTAYLTTQGNTASQSTTQLGAMMTALMKPNEAMMKGLSQLGFQSGEAAIKQLGLRGAFAALSGTSAATTEGMAAMVGTTEALRGVTALASEDVGGFMSTFTSGIEGATDAAKAIQMEGAAAQFGLLKSTMSEAANSIGEALIPMLVDLAREARPVIQTIIDWIKQNPTLVAGIAKVVAIVAAVGSAMMVLGPVISGVGAVLGVLLSPIGLIVAAVAGLFVAFQNNFLGIRDLLQPVIDWVSSKFEGLIGSIQNFGQNMEQGGIGEAISSVLANILQFFGGTEEGTMSMARNIVDGFINVFTAIVDFVQTTVIPGIQAFFTFLGNAWALIGPALGDLANWFLNDVLPQVVTFVNTVVIPAVQSFVGFLGSLWAIVGPALGALADWFITSALPAITSFISDTVLPAIQQFGLMLLNLWETVKPGLLDLADWFITTALPAIVTFIEDTVVPGVQKFVDILVNIWTLVQPVLQQLFDWFITTGLPFIQDAIQWAIDTFIQPLIDLIGDIWELVEPALTSLYNWFITEGLPAIQDGIQWFLDNIVTPLVTQISGIWESVKPGLDNLKTGIETIFNWIKDNIIKPVSDAFGNLINTIATADLNPFDSSGVMLNPFAQGGLFNRDSGGMGQAGQPYLIGAGAQPELFVPSSAGRFYPNADRLLGGRNDENGTTLNISGITIHANSAAEGRAAAEGFEKRLSELIAARGGM